MRKQFDIKYRPQIESGEYKVETRDELPARVICWDRRGERPLVVLVQQRNGYDDGRFYYESGLADGVGQESDGDLFIITPEPELSEFEHAFGLAIVDAPEPEEKEEWYPYIKEKAAELLSLARDQFIKDGYVLEKQSFQDAVEKIDDKDKAEMSIQYSLHCKVENGTRHAVMNWEAFQKVAQKFIDIGKEEALKDLPRWEKSDEEVSHVPVLFFGLNGDYLHYKGCAISVESLEKLPGFKEENSHE